MQQAIPWGTPVQRDLQPHLVNAEAVIATGFNIERCYFLSP